MPINQQFPSQTLHPLMEPNPSNQPPWFINNQHPLPNFNLNHDVHDQALDNEATITSPLKEPMFEKPLTPSDVGKLNRLVIPKQNAEKYFPLGGGLDSGGDKGMLLSFEDELGKCWRFRYSYWNSSQSYVLTKGWSRYVKEKQLDAGDVVLFERHRRDVERLFIGWRRKGSDSSSNSGAMVHGSGSGPWSRGLYPRTSTSTTTTTSPSPSPYPSTPSVHQQHGHEPHHAGNSKRTVRLFGVNLECGLEESEPSTPDNSSSSLSSQSLAHPYQFYPSDHQLPSFHTHMDITFSRDVDQMRDHRG